jgi:aspartyl-tRNA(Asn)/glutamyl-tRNA(Gln) amidotransferase subunit A
VNVAALTIAQLREAYLTKSLTPAEAITALAEEIDRKDPSIGGYLSYDLGLALADAARADLSLPLGGVPIAIKDLINVEGHPCSCASKILHGKYTSPYDATVVRKLRAAGAIPFGRTNMDEFAMGSSNENSGIKPCHNPHDTSRIPGGSSGGSAAVVASHTAIAALGTDTGGSIRQPASHCGVVGLKPTYGRVSRFGLVAFASSLDQCGPMTKTVADAAALLEVISGACDRDSTCLPDEVPRYTDAIGRDVKGLRIGLPSEYFAAGLDPQVKERVESAIRLRFGLPARISAELKARIKQADQSAAFYEATRLAGFDIDEALDFFGAPPPGPAPDMTPMSPIDAQALFLRRFEALQGEIDRAR